MKKVILLLFVFTFSVNAMLEKKEDIFERSVDGSAKGTFEMHDLSEILKKQERKAERLYKKLGLKDETIKPLLVEFYNEKQAGKKRAKSKKKGKKNQKGESQSLESQVIAFLRARMVLEEERLESEKEAFKKEFTLKQKEFEHKVQSSEDEARSNKKKFKLSLVGAGISAMTAVAALGGLMATLLATYA